MGRVAIVTGAGSGLGHGRPPRLLAAEGAPVACFDIAADAAEKTAAEIAEHGGAARAYRVDVSDPASVKDAVAAAWRDLGHPADRRQLRRHRQVRSHPRAAVRGVAEASSA